jgi:hypothetical protein
MNKECCKGIWQYLTFHFQTSLSMRSDHTYCERGRCPWNRRKLQLPKRSADDGTAVFIYDSSLNKMTEIEETI